MNIRRAMDEHGSVRVEEIDTQIEQHLAAVRALYAERIALTMHGFIAAATQERDA